MKESDEVIMNEKHSTEKGLSSGWLHFFLAKICSRVIKQLKAVVVTTFRVFKIIWMPN